MGGGNSTGSLAGDIKGARSALARWIDGHLRITSIAALVVVPLAGWKVVELAAWVL